MEYHQSTNRELIQIALGNDSCIISSYLTYLQGLAGTTGNTNSTTTNYCDIGTTHSSSSSQSQRQYDCYQYYTPRVLFVDGTGAIHNSTTSTTLPTGVAANTTANSSNNDNLQYNGFPIDTINRFGEPITSSSTLDPLLLFQSNVVTDNDYYNSNIHHWNDDRYRVPLPKKPSSTTTTTTTPKYNVSSNGRHVDWDDDNEVEEEETNNDYYNDRNDYYRHPNSTTLVADQYKKTRISSITAQELQHQQQQQQQQQSINVSNNSNDTNADTDYDVDVRWEDDIMRLSPYDRSKSFLFVPSVFLPTTTSSNDNSVGKADNGTVDPIIQHGITYHQACSMSGTVSSSSDFDQAGQWTEWKCTLLEDKLRHRLEECDSCQGLVVMNDNTGLFSGLSTSILQEMKDECPSLATWNIAIDTKKPSSSSISSMDNTNDIVTTFHRHAMIQSIVERGLALHHTVEYASATLPLQLQQQYSVTDELERSSRNDMLVQAAIALESCTLPYRLSSSTSSDSNGALIGLHGLHYYGTNDNSNFPFGSTPTMGFAEFIKSLHSHSSTRLRRIWELDTYMNCCNTNTNTTTSNSSSSSSNTNTIDLWKTFTQGTSFEHDQRMVQRQSTSSAPMSPPGNWMLNIQPSTNNDHGLLTSLSPSASNILHSNTIDSSITDRSKHYHFALSTSFRPTCMPILDASKAPTNQLTPVQQYVSAIMQSIGIRFRPESSSVTVIPQSLGTVLQSSSSTAPSKLLRHIQEQQQNGTKDDDYPIISVLGNTTRRYSYLNDVAIEFKRAFTPGTADRGYYRRQVALNLLPDEDDCQDALEACYEIRDAYIPPNYNDNDYNIDF